MNIFVTSKVACDVHFVGLDKHKMASQFGKEGIIFKAFGILPD
jgi:hypothetical protein